MPINEPAEPGPPWPTSTTNDRARVYWGQGIREALWNDDTEMAGGPHYVQNNDVLTEADCDRTINTRSQLIDVCTSSSFERAWLGSNIDIGSSQFNVRNVTIAGDRGVNGSRGPMIYTNSTSNHYRTSRYDHMRVQDSNVKFTGIRVRGPAYNNWSNPEYPGFMPLTDDNRFHKGHQWLRIQPGGFTEIENCEIYGFGVQAIGVGYAVMRRVSDAEAHIHHSDLHDDMMTSLGYAWTCYQGYVHTEYCYYDAHRHSCNWYGPAEATGLVENCIFGPNHSRSIIDHHGVGNNTSSSVWSSDPNHRIWRYRGGGDTTVRYNTFTTANMIHGPEIQSAHVVGSPGRPEWVYSNRGIPMPGTSHDIHNNRIVQPGPQTNNPGRNGTVNNYTQDAFVQGIYTSSGVNLDSNGFQRVNFYDNQYDGWHGGEEYDPNYGAPYNLDGATPVPTAQLRVYVRRDEDDIF